MTVRTRAQLKSDAAATFPDNSSGEITPQDLRDRWGDVADSALLAEDVIDEDDMASDSDTKVPTQQSVRAYVDVLGLRASDFGALPSASASVNAAAFQNFFDTLASIGGRGVIEPGSYDIDDTVVITGADFSVYAKDAFFVPDAALDIALQFGETGSILQRVYFESITVDRASYSGASENYGILFKFCANSTFVDLFSRESKYNIALEPPNSCSVAYNTFINTRGFNGFHNVRYNPSGSGFANENAWLGGRLANSVDTEYNLYIAGGNSSNENKFYGVSMEATSGVTASTAAAYINGVANIIHHPRFEGTWASGAAVILDTSSVRNEISTPRFDSEVSDRGAGNQVYSGRLKKLTQTVAGREGFRINRSTNSAQTAFTSAPTADTTANSATITVSSSSELAIGNTISIAGAVQNARIEYINGTSVVLDRPAALAVTGVTVTRGQAPVLDVGDHLTSTANGYGLSIWTGRTGSGVIMADGYARGSKIFEILGNSTFVLGANQVLTTRRTGWAAATGTATRTTFDTTTVTTAQLAERLKALLDDLTTHGLIGS